MLVSVKSHGCASVPQKVLDQFREDIRASFENGRLTRFQAPRSG
jgi:hypothetical protein